MRAAYTGHETLTFTDYTDLETGRTLTAEPGQSYDLAPASGRNVPDIPTGWFAAAEAAPEAAPEAELTEEKRDEIRDLYNSGMDPSQTGQVAGVRADTVLRVLTEMGTGLRPDDDPAHEPQQF